MREEKKKSAGINKRLIQSYFLMNPNNSLKTSLAHRYFLNRVEICKTKKQHKNQNIWIEGNTNLPSLVFEFYSISKTRAFLISNTI